jgi:serine/threonine-protein kinase
MTNGAFGSRARGRLDLARVAALVREIHAAGKSGVLHLTRDGVSRRLYFRAGSIILAGSDLPEDRLGQALVRAGMIREADLERALAVVEAGGRSIGEAIVEMGLLRKEQVQAEADRRTKLIVDSVLDWESGEFAFEEREERLEGELLSELDVEQALAAWARRARPEAVAAATRAPGVAPGPPGQAAGAGTQLWAALEAERTDAGGLGGTLGLGGRLPESLGRYVVERAIGRGSMGAVLLARDPAIDRRVAVKLIQTSVQLTPAEWEKYKERFYREARAAGKLLHQGIVAIFDVGHTLEGIPFIVMEYVEGRTLAAYAQDRKLPLDEVLRLAGDCLEALDYAHAQGVVHRDLKPANIMIAADGRPKIMDFGVAHVVGSQMTQADEILGSPHFMAPEQLGKGKVDQRTDLFAFGVVLYWMLTGQLPFTGDSFAAIAQAVLSERPVLPAELKREAPRALGNIVLRCLEKDPGRRFPTARELRAAIRAVEKPPRAGWLNAMTALVLLAAVLGAAYVRFKARAAEPRPAASAVPAARPSPPAAAAASPPAAERSAPGGATPAPTARAEDPEALWRKTLPLTFAARHAHRIGGCEGTLVLDASGIEYRSKEHERLRLRFAEIRALERQEPSKLRVETRERDYNFTLTSRPLSDADWARYRRLAKK